MNFFKQHIVGILIWGIVAAFLYDFFDLKPERTFWTLITQPPHTTPPLTVPKVIHHGPIEKAENHPSGISLSSDSTRNIKTGNDNSQPVGEPIGIVRFVPDDRETEVGNQAVHQDGVNIPSQRRERGEALIPPGGQVHILMMKIRIKVMSDKFNIEKTSNIEIYSSNDECKTLNNFTEYNIYVCLINTGQTPETLKINGVGTATPQI
ncbi:MAG: hypothetical protein HY221_02285 [Candidatus Sungbacteria bacterium]|uniref:Uncharacterized protein n=1 Tax=Candidatus Sungiibacteriota bacterium TaxID=2750080 RepID=A0A932QYF2_9BACT|nr:hypothetical protein [Candidatus Sungbacteria bacterium]